jgi:hypothetical protein
VLALWCVPIVYLLSRRAGVTHPGLVQVRLNDYGCVQYDDLAGPSVVRDVLGAWSWAFPAIVAVGFVMCYGLAQISTFTFCIGLVVAVTVALWWYPGCRAYRARLAAQAEGAVADANTIRIGRTPWGKIEVVALFPTKADRVHLWLVAQTPPRHRTRIPVDAELRCTPEEMPRLRELLDQWCPHQKDK